MKNPTSKLELAESRIEVPAAEVQNILSEIFDRLSCRSSVSHAIAHHLVDTSLCGMESHGVMRVLQYAEQMRTGYMRADAEPRVTTSKTGAEEIDGRGGSGIPAMILAYDRVSALAEQNGIAAMAVRNVGHTGRHGAYAETAAEKGFMTICIGGGNRQNWRQVAPHGGARAVLPTNPWCIGIPGGARGPVVLDFATSMIAGGWIYAARSAGALLPEGCLMDREGRPSRDPEDYFAGGAILPAGGHKGYGLALMGELVADALLGPPTTECHWLVIALATSRFRAPGPFQSAAEEVLAELRACPPASGFERVEIPGERERAHRDASKGMLALPQATWRQIQDLAGSLQ